MTPLPPIWTLIAIALSIAALFVAYLNFRRKSSIQIAGGYSLTSSVECEEKFVSRVLLENRKDRPVTIFEIHLLVGYGFYIQLESFEDSPLILKPYETITRKYGPIELYSVNMRRIDMGSILDAKGVRHRLVLSTSQGRYVVKQFRRRWSAITEHFKNHSIAIIRPVHSQYKGRHVGGNIKFVLELIDSDGNTEIVMLRRESYTLQTFKRFRLTKDSLESAEALTRFLQERQTEGFLVAKSFKVLDAQQWRDAERSNYPSDLTIPRNFNLFEFYVLGRLRTIFANRSTHAENKRQARLRSLATPNPSVELRPNGKASEQAPGVIDGPSAGPCARLSVPTQPER